MIPAIKSEFRKLLTIRSTYFISFLSIALVIFFSFYIEGLRGADSVLDGNKLQNVILSAAALMPVFGALIAILLVAHEYRYNTIMYTLTSINRRSKVFIAKILALTTYTIIFMAAGIGLGVASMYLGLHIKGLTLIPQHIEWGNIIWRVVFYSWAYTMFGFVLGILTRNVVAAIVTIFILPSTAEPLLGLLLKDNAKYLPVTALSRVVDTSNSGLTPASAAMVFSIYLVAAGVIGWFLFLERDAN